MYLDVKQINPFIACYNGKEKYYGCNEALSYALIQIDTETNTCYLICSNSYILVRIPIALDERDEILDFPVYLSKDMYQYAKKNKINNFFITKEGIKVGDVLFPHITDITYPPTDFIVEKTKTPVVLELQLHSEQLTNIFNCQKITDNVLFRLYFAEDSFWYSITDNKENELGIGAIKDSKSTLKEYLRLDEDVPSIIDYKERIDQLIKELEQATYRNDSLQKRYDELYTYSHILLNKLEIEQERNNQPTGNNLELFPENN